MAQNKQKELDELKLKQQHMQDTLKELMTFLQVFKTGVSLLQHYYNTSQCTLGVRHCSFQGPGSAAVCLAAIQR